jgi:hypothetical protein
MAKITIVTCASEEMENVLLFDESGQITGDTTQAMYSDMPCQVYWTP